MLKMVLRHLVLLLVVCASPAMVTAQDNLKKQYSDDELVDILTNDGFRAVERVEERTIQIKVDGSTFIMHIYDDDDLQLYFGVTGYVIDAGQINEWNRTRRLSRAYLDDENDPILESDLLANVGYTEQQLLEWLKVFSLSANEFRRFLIENDQEE